MSIPPTSTAASKTPSWAAAPCATGCGGTCYRAAIWIEVGAARGYGRARESLNYVRHGAPKTAFV